MRNTVCFSSSKLTKRLLTSVIASCGLLLFIPACHIPALRQSEPTPSLPDNFNIIKTTNISTPLAGVLGGVGVATLPTSASISTEKSAQVGIEQFYNDPILLKLISEAIANNQELKIRAEDIQIASNEIWGRTGAYLPFLSLGTSAGFDKSSRYTTQGAVEKRLDFARDRHFPDPLPNFMFAANLSWQVDIWRKLRNARDAATLRYLATTEGRNYIVTRLVADLAEDYFSLMALDKRLEYLDMTIQLQDQSYQFAKANFDAGRGNGLAVQRFQAEVRKNQSEKLIVKQDIIEAENRINFLVGRFPQYVERRTSEFIDLSMSAPSVGIPSQLLQNRPDIRQAERELEANGLDVVVARAEFYPSLDISANIGYEAFNPKYLFNPGALIAGAAGNIVGPLINKRAIQAAYANANARQLQSIYNYQRVVLNAFTEVVNRVSAEDNYRKSIEIKKQQLQALEASVDAATQLFQNARAEYIEVLFAQRDLLEARTVLIETKRQQLSAIVNAYQALGGGNLVPAPAVNSPQANRQQR